MTAHPNQPPMPPDDWQPTSGGEVARLARTLKRRKSRRQFLGAAAGATAGLLALAGGWWLFRPAQRQRQGGYDFGGITCSEVTACTDDFLRGRLPPEKAAKVRLHLELCPHCGPRFERLGWVGKSEAAPGRRRSEGG